MIAAKGKSNSRELINKFFEGQYPADIERRFHLWLLNESKQEEKEQALEDIWETIPHGDPKTVTGSLHDVKRKLGLPEKTVRLGNRRIGLKVAAVIIPALLVAGAYLLMERTVYTPSELMAVTIEATAGTTVKLPDNSVVEITEGVLFYPSEFTGSERKVRLEGSGYFEVAGNAEMPFVVENDLLTVRVVGTEFMLATDRDNGTFSLALVEGKVDVHIAGKETISLIEGNEIKYDAGSGEVVIEELPASLNGKEALTHGQLIFENNTIAEILEAAARSRGYELAIKYIHSGSKAYNIKFIDGENIETILGVLNVLTNSSFTYIIENNKIYIE